MSRISRWPATSGRSARPSLVNRSEPQQSDGWPAVMSRVRTTLLLGSQLLGDIIGASPHAVSAWQQGQGSPEPVVQYRLRQLDSLRQVLEETTVPERIVAIVHDRAVPLLGGRTYAEALAAGVNIDILVDLARSAAGLPCETPAGREYLEGPNPEGLILATAWISDQS